MTAFGLVQDCDEIECQGGSLDGWRFSKEAMAISRKPNDQEIEQISTIASETYAPTGDITSDGKAEIYRICGEDSDD